MNAHGICGTPRRCNLTSLAITLMCALVVCFGLATSMAQPTQDSPPQAEDERKFENTIPAHVPLKVKLKNEQAFKHPKNTEWGRDLEIEVKNTGTKPIYFMYMVVRLRDFVLEDGNPVGFQVKYGRGELVLMDTPILPGDVPILPGESVTLTIPETQWKGYEAIRNKKNKSDPKKVSFDLQLINFGDGTGLQSTKGEPTPTLNRKRSQNTPLPKQWAGFCQLPSKAPRDDTPTKFLKVTYLLRPADFLRVDYFSPAGLSLRAPSRFRLQLPEHLELLLRSDSVREPLSV